MLVSVLPSGNTEYYHCHWSSQKTSMWFKTEIKLFIWWMTLLYHVAFEQHDFVGRGNPAVCIMFHIGFNMEIHFQTTHNKHNAIVVDIASLVTVYLYAPRCLYLIMGAKNIKSIVTLATMYLYAPLCLNLIMDANTSYFQCHCNMNNTH